jgi:hypothetical protein
MNILTFLQSFYFNIYREYIYSFYFKVKFYGINYYYLLFSSKYEIIFTHQIK